MVHSKAITETTIDAIGEVNGRLWCATKGLFGLSVFALLMLPFCAQCADVIDDDGQNAEEDELGKG